MVNTKQFRTDINGLRAYAVAFVVLYHFHVLGFSAGFIGVDIFFVISGYLMTKILIEQIELNKLSTWKFYLARGIRILPALLFLTVFLELIGWFLLIPEDYKKYNENAASSITFISNIIYWRKSSNYFSTEAHDNLLLHTWSLSVEWQFYILLPIVLGIIGKIKRSKALLNSAVAIGFIISLVLCYAISQTNQTTAFYMLPTRAWEMLAGGVVYAYASNLNLNKRINTAIELIGFFLIVLSMVLFGPKTVWPSINALLPVLGTMLVLAAPKNDSVFTNPRLVQWVGSASYSIYLWHWPIVFYLMYFGVVNNELYIALGIIISIILGGLSFKYIENPTRKYLSKHSIIKGYSILIGITLLLFVVYGYVFLKNGIPSRGDQEYQTQVKQMVMPLPNNGWCFYSVDSISSLPIGEKILECKIGSIANVKQKALLFGDSFAGQNIPFWDEVGKKLNWEVQPITTNWCYPSLGDRFPGTQPSRAFEQCKFNRKYLSEKIDQYDVVILAGLWRTVNNNQQDMRDVKELIKVAAAKNKLVIIMGAPYSFNANIGAIYKRSLWFHQTFSVKKYMDNADDLPTQIADEQLAHEAKLYTNVIFIERKDLFSETQITEGNRPYSFDGHHISVFGSKESAKYFEKTEQFKQLSDFLK